MVKTFKRIAALAMAIALVVCFAVSASAAVTVGTTTTYTPDSENLKVNVTVNVSGDEISSGTEVTYYATNGSTTVYIDQTTANGSGVATFNFQTAATNLKSAVKVGYTAGTAAEDSDINAKAISYNGTVLAKIPTAETTATVTVPYTAEAGYTVGSVNADGDCTVGTISYDGTNITVPLTEINSDVTLTVTPVEEEQDTSNATILDAAMVYDEDASSRKLTVLGVANGSEDFGVIITEATINTTYTKAEMDELKKNFVAFEAKIANDNGAFAVQVIDEATDAADTLIAADGSYNVAVYVKESNSDNYKAVLFDKVVTLVQE